MSQASAPQIPDDVRSALRDYLMRSGLAEDSADGLLDAIALDLADGDADARAIYDRLVAAGTQAAAERILASVNEIAHLASIPVAPELPEGADVE